MILLLLYESHIAIVIAIVIVIVIAIVDIKEVAVVIHVDNNGLGLL